MSLERAVTIVRPVMLHNSWGQQCRPNFQPLNCPRTHFRRQTLSLHDKSVTQRSLNNCDMAEAENENPDDKARKRRDARIRKDLLSPSEAKAEMLRRLANTLPDLPAFAAVIVMGALGAALAHYAHLSIGEKDLTSTVSKLSLGLLMVFGSFGAAVTVFFLAKTDTSKLIHCAII